MPVLLRARRFGPVLAVLALIAALAAPAAVEAATVAVSITNRLEPAVLEVAAGTTIRWVNRDDERHRMRSQSGPGEFDSGTLEPGESFSVRLSARGTYASLDERDDDNSR